MGNLYGGPDQCEVRKIVPRRSLRVTTLTVTPVARRRRPDTTDITADVTLRHLLGDESVWIRMGALFYILDIKFPVTYSPH